MRAFTPVFAGYGETHLCLVQRSAPNPAGTRVDGFRKSSTHPTANKLPHHFCGWLKYFKSGGFWPFLAGIRWPSALII